MEMQESVSQETSSQESASTPQSSDTQQAPQAQPSQEQASLSPQAGDLAAAAQAAYNPNFKFKVNNQEREFDPWIRDVVKDADTEKKIRELYEKAYGLDIVKPRFHEERTAHRTLQDRFSKLSSRVMPVEDALAKGDMSSVFKHLNLTDEKVFKYAWDRLNYLDKPQEYRNAYEAQQAAEARAADLEGQIQASQQAQMAHSVQARTVELETALSQPDIKSIVEAFDARVGSPGAFAEEVIKRGKLAYYTSGKDITVQDAVKEVVGILGAQQGQSSNPAQVAPPQAAQAQQQAPGSPAPRTKHPVIPTVAAKPQSPAARVVRSVEDLNKLRKEKFGS